MHKEVLLSLLPEVQKKDCGIRRSAEFFSLVNDEAVLKTLRPEERQEVLQTAAELRQRLLDGAPHVG